MNDHLGPAVTTRLLRVPGDHLPLVVTNCASNRLSTTASEPEPRSLRTKGLIRIAIGRKNLLSLTRGGVS